MNRLLASMAITVASACSAEPTIPFKAWGKSGDDADARFCTSLGAIEVTGDATGKLRIAGRRTASLPIGKSETVDWLWSTPVESDILVAYESTDRTADGSGGGLCRFSGDLTKRRWCTLFPAFNVVASLSSGKTVFLAGIGTVAEVDTRSGKYLWKVGGLYERSHAFNAFLTPIEEGNMVKFFATEGTGRAAPWKAVIDRRSGKLNAAVAVPSLEGSAVEVVRSAGPCAM